VTGFEGLSEWSIATMNQVTLILFVMLAWGLIFGVSGYFDDKE
jgi:hypothetical protein